MFAKYNAALLNTRELPFLALILPTAWFAIYEFYNGMRAR